LAPPKKPEAARPLPASKPSTTPAKSKDGKRRGIRLWWRETVGELRKVTWPTLPDAWKLTRVVLIVMGAMSLLLGLLDFLFSRMITALLG
jgi:preprotein translocase subunit SecE